MMKTMTTEEASAPREGTMRVQPPTMKSIADSLGVSRQLVSLVLRDQPGASESTRQRVRDAARELGYYPDASARALRGKRTRRLGVLFSMRQPFEVDLVEALFKAAGSRGFSLVLAPMTPARPQGVAVAELLGQRVEGIFVLSDEADGASADRLPPTVPHMVLGGPHSADAAGDLRVDDARGIRLVMEHLFGLGHRRICYVSGGDGYTWRRRTSAYRQVMADSGAEDEIDVLEADSTEAGGARAAQSIQERSEMPTAILGANDRCAAGILVTLARAGIKVPGAVSVAGFDDSSVSRLPFMDLTTVGYVPNDLSERAVEAMADHLENPTPKPTVHREAPYLVTRGSTGKPREEP